MSAFLALPEGADPDDAARAGSAFSPASFGLAGAPGVVAVELVELSLLGTSGGFPVSSAKIAGTRRKVVTVKVAMMRFPISLCSPEWCLLDAKRTKEPTSHP